jgi:dethiobiotin synthetase
VRIDPAGILADWRRHRDRGGRDSGGRGRRRGRELVVEGAGGLLVPLDDAGTLLVDVVAAMGLPALVVARSSLGTINHTLLTLEALRARQVAIAGVVLVGPPNADNRDAIATFGRVAVLAEVPPLSRVDAAGVADAAADFDRDAKLAACLGAPG